MQARSGGAARTAHPTFGQSFSRREEQALGGRMLGSTRGEGGGHSPFKAYAFGVYELVGGGAGTVLTEDHGRRDTLKA